MIEAQSPPANAPAPIWSIAIVALLPFLISAAVYVYGPETIAYKGLTSILAWSTVVLSFLGGVRWGLESARPEPRALRLAISTVSSVAAWLLLLMRSGLGSTWTLVGFLAAFLVQWLFDHTAPDVPARYPRLSTTLTAGACLSLAMALEKALRM